MAPGCLLFFYTHIGFYVCHTSENPMLNKNQPAVDILTDLINSTNSTFETFRPYEHGELIFKDLTADFDNGPDAVKVMAALRSDADEASWTPVYYKRVSITAFIPDTLPRLPYKDSYIDVHSILADINTLLNIQLTSSDVVNFSIDLDHRNKDGTLNVPIMAERNALIIRGSTAVVLTDLPEPEKN